MVYDKNKLFNIVIVAVVALAAGYIFLSLAPDIPVRGDTVSYYHPIAESLASGQGFWINNEPTARIAPGYPFLLSLVYRLGGGFYEMYILQIFFLAGIGIITYLIARKFLPEPFSLIASLNIIVWPYLLLYTKLILTEITFILFLLLALHSVLRFSEKQSFKNALLAGCLLGLAALIRPIGLLLPFWIVGASVAYSYFFDKRYIWSNWKKMVVILAAFAIVLSPWTIRNAIQFGAFIPVASGLSDSIYRGYESLDYTLGSQALEKGEVTIADNVVARVRNIYLFWNPGAGGTNAELFIQENQLFGLAFGVYKIIFLLTVLLAFLALLFKKSKGMFILASIVLYFWIIHTILYPYPRYTLPTIPLVIIFSWIAISHLWQKIYLKYKLDYKK